MSETAKHWKIICKSDNPNKCLWLNKGIWWAAFTISDGVETHRMRFNMKTRDVEKARRNRDRIIDAINNEKRPIRI